MKREKLSEALTNIDSAFIEEAEEPYFQKQPRPWRRVLPVAACFGIFLVGAVTILPYFQSADTATDGALPNDAAAGDQMIDQTVPEGAQSSDESKESDGAITEDLRLTLRVNVAKLQETAASDLLLSEEDFVAMDDAALLSYYGADLSPLDGFLTPIDAPAPRGIYRRSGGIGEVYYDANSLSYEASNGTAKLTLTLSKAVSTPRVIVEDLEEDTLCFTPIHGRELTIFSMEGESGAGYYVEWLQNGAGWRLWVGGISEEELTALLEALVQPIDEPLPRTAEGRLIAIDPVAGGAALQLQDGSALSLVLPKRFNFEAMTLFDPWQVEWEGEPALLRTLLPEQLVSFEPMKGDGL